MMISRFFSTYSEINATCSKKWLLSSVLIFFTTLLLHSSPCQGELRLMSASEMQASTAQAGFTDFTMENNTARLFVDIHMETFATIRNFSAGSYDNGWDLQWKNVKVGNSVDDPLSMDGLVFIADFDAQSNLERIVVGTNRLQGDISANMSSFSGAYNDALLNGSGNMVSPADRTNLGQQTFHFNSNATPDKNMGLYFVLSGQGDNMGVQVIAGYDDKTITTLAPGVWWDSP